MQRLLPTPGPDRDRRAGAAALLISPSMRRFGLALRAPLARLVLVVFVGAAGVLGAGCSSTGTPKAAGASANTGPYHAAGVLSPPRAAPPLQLDSYLGQPVDINAYRGKALLVTFLYTHCPDVCPLITSNLRVALEEMGPAVASKAQVIAVSVDPRGDTPKAVAAFLAAHGMTGRMQYLVGSASQLARVWSAWGVGSERDAQNPELVNHSGLVYGITASGKQATIYAANFRPSDIAHDVPLLASS
jgi:protein SCO1/2